jgi:N-acyl-D-aspartate/D-glutamate deacylase
VAPLSADLYGVRERGLIRVGWHADVLVIDPETVGTEDVVMRYRRPGQALRRVHRCGPVLVNGRSVVADGRLTGARPGTLLRSGRETSTPTLM